MKRPLKNHHGRPSEHAPGDPLGVYMPPFNQWRRSTMKSGMFDEATWIHPALGWAFCVTWVHAAWDADAWASVTCESHGLRWLYRTIPTRAISPTDAIWYEKRPNAESAYKQLHDWYANLNSAHLWSDRSASRNSAKSQGSASEWAIRLAPGFSGDPAGLTLTSPSGKKVHARIGVTGKVSFDGGDRRLVPASVIDRANRLASRLAAEVHSSQHPRRKAR